MSLRHATAELGVHRKAELTPFGQRMANGTMGMQEWADWLYAMQILHHELDPGLPPSLQRAPQFSNDLDVINRAPHYLCSVEGLVRAVCYGPPQNAEALAYVLCGANARGGQVVKKALGDRFPHSHLEFDNFEEPNQWFRNIDARMDLLPYVAAMFAAVIAIMAEIDALN